MGRVLQECTIQVRWRDLDAFDHVNHASFATFIEEARVRWFRSLGADWADPACAPILAALSINYRRPIGWPTTVHVELRNERLGNKSLTLAHRIVDAGDGQRVYADGNQVIVWTDRAGAALPLPHAVRVACAD